MTSNTNQPICALAARLLAAAALFAACSEPTTTATATDAGDTVTFRLGDSAGGATDAKGDSTASDVGATDASDADIAPDTADSQGSDVGSGTGDAADAADACVKSAPKDEGCDGVDEDCDGETDEEARCEDDNPCTFDACTLKGCTNAPLVDGTPCVTVTCGKNCVCADEVCNAPCTKVDGVYTPWAYGACSAPCGGGTKTGTRTCTNPAPSCGGKPCEGPATSTEPCNTDPCSSDNWSSGKHVFSQGGEVVEKMVGAGVSKVVLLLWGGGGGGGAPGGGGGGAFVHVELAVQPGQKLAVRVAEAGKVPSGGAGASVVTLDGKPVAMAAGGGGAGVDGCSGCTAAGDGKVCAGGAGGAVGFDGQAGTGGSKYGITTVGGGGGGPGAGGSKGTIEDKSSYTGCLQEGGVGGKDEGGQGTAGNQCKLAEPAAKLEKASAAGPGNGAGGFGGAGWYGGGGGAGKYTYIGSGGGGGSSYFGNGALPVGAGGEAGQLAVPGGASHPDRGGAGDGGLGCKAGNCYTGEGAMTAGTAGRIIVVVP